VDVPRTAPELKLFQTKPFQQSLERVLYIWSIRHPASGYVQGINDLSTPFYLVFLNQVTGKLLEDLDVETITDDDFNIIEADSFWCLSKLLDGIQDHYTFAQPGIQRMVYKLKELINRIDVQLHDHLVEQKMDFNMFAYRWMNCLLMREIPLPLIIRVWDTYLSEEGGDGFMAFHVYVCAAFLKRWSAHLKTLEFQDLVLFLQHLPTDKWEEKDIELLLSEAFVFKTLFHGAPRHLV